MSTLPHPCLWTYPKPSTFCDHGQRILSTHRLLGSTVVWSAEKWNRRDYLDPSRLITTIAESKAVWISDGASWWMWRHELAWVNDGSTRKAFGVLIQQWRPGFEEQSRHSDIILETGQSARMEFHGFEWEKEQHKSGNISYIDPLRQKKKSPSPTQPTTPYPKPNILSRIKFHSWAFNNSSVIFKSQFM